MTPGPGGGTQVKPQFLRIRNWERFQHYTNRRPPWIKFHISILDDHTLLSLPPMSQLVYDRLLLRAAVTDNNVEHDPVWLSQKFNLPADEIQEAVVNLVDAGFLSVSGRKRAASKAIAKRQQNGVSEAEAEAETEREAEAEQTARVLELPALPLLETVPSLPSTDEKVYELERLLRLCRDADAGSLRELSKAAETLTLGGVARVRESCEKRRGRIGVGYAVNALKSEASAA